jgi:Uma2 family endonuclease
MMGTIAVPAIPLAVKLGAGVRLGDTELHDLCVANPDLRIERNAQGNVIVMTPAGGRSSNREAKVIAALEAWATSTGERYLAFSSSVGFLLPNGAMRSPDGACVLASRLAGRGDQNERFLPLCPDLLVEVRSPSDDLPDLLAKMVEYRDHGARLGWLVDPYEQRVHVFRPDQPVEILDRPERLLGDPEFSGLVLELERIWQSPL